MHQTNVKINKFWTNQLPFQQNFQKEQKEWLLKKIQNNKKQEHIQEPVQQVIQEIIVNVPEEIIVFVPEDSYENPDKINEVPDNEVPDNEVPDNEVPDNEVPDNEIPDEEDHDKEDHDEEDHDEEDHNKKVPEEVSEKINSGINIYIKDIIIKKENRKNPDEEWRTQKTKKVSKKRSQNWKNKNIQINNRWIKLEDKTSMKNNDKKNDDKFMKKNDDKFMKKNDDKFMKKNDDKFIKKNDEKIITNLIKLSNSDLLSVILETCPKNYNNIQYIIKISNEKKNISANISTNISNVSNVSSNRWEKGIHKVIEHRQVEQLITSKNAWKPNKTPEGNPDILKIKGILNKLVKDNLEKMLQEIIKLDYMEPLVIELILSKTILEPCFWEVYAEFLDKLPGIYDVLVYSCLEQFTNKRHKNLCNFIVHYYELGIIADLNTFFNVLKTYKDDSIEQLLRDKDVEILCTFINKIPEDKINIFIDTIEYLRSIKDIQKSSRIKFMIMDTLKL